MDELESGLGRLCIDIVLVVMGLDQCNSSAGGVAQYKSGSVVLETNGRNVAACKRESESSIFEWRRE